MVRGCVGRSWRLRGDPIREQGVEEAGSGRRSKVSHSGDEENFEEAQERRRAGTRAPRLRLAPAPPKFRYVGRVEGLGWAHRYQGKLRPRDLRGPLSVRPRSSPPRARGGVLGRGGEVGS